MKPHTKTKTLLSGFFHVGPETKGYGVEMVLAFFMLLSLAMFAVFSFGEDTEQFSGNITPEESYIATVNSAE